MIYQTSSERLYLLSVGWCICPSGFYIFVRLVCILYLDVCEGDCGYVYRCLRFRLYVCFLKRIPNYIKSYINTTNLWCTSRDDNNRVCQIPRFSNTLLVGLSASGLRGTQTRPSQKVASRLGKETILTPLLRGLRKNVAWAYGLECPSKKKKKKKRPCGTYLSINYTKCPSGNDIQSRQKVRLKQQIKFYMHNLQFLCL